MRGMLCNVVVSAPGDSTTVWCETAARFLPSLALAHRSLAKLGRTAAKFPQKNHVFPTFRLP